jgi:hypothetical protein
MLPKKARNKIKDKKHRIIGAKKYFIFEFRLKK